MQLSLSAVLDANVLYPAPLRDLLLSVAEIGLFRPIWSDRIHSEWTHNLLVKRPDLQPKQLMRTVQLMHNAFPDANTFDIEDIEQTVNLPDQGDNHVLAVAIKRQVDYIVTNNKRDFPVDVLNLYQVIPIDPDKFLIELLQRDEKRVIEAVYNQLARLRQPKLDITELMSKYQRNGLRKFSASLSGFIS
jgi:predicted nucleic acid-binding protein